MERKKIKNKLAANILAGAIGIGGIAAGTMGFVGCTSKDDDKSDEIARLIQIINEQQGKYDSLFQEIEELNKENQELKSQLVNLENKFANNNSLLQNFQEQLSINEEMRQQDLKKQATLEKQISKLEQTNNTNEAEKKHLLSQLEELKKSSNNTNEQQKLLEKQISKLEQSNQQILQEKEHLVEQISSLRYNIDLLYQNDRILLSQIQTLQDEKVALENEIADLRQSLEELRNSTDNNGVLQKKKDFFVVTATTTAKNMLDNNQYFSKQNSYSSEASDGYFYTSGGEWALSKGLEMCGAYKSNNSENRVYEDAQFVSMSDDVTSKLVTSDGSSLGTIEDYRNGYLNQDKLLGMLCEQFLDIVDDAHDVEITSLGENYAFKISSGDWNSYFGEYEETHNVNCSSNKIEIERIYGYGYTYSDWTTYYSKSHDNETYSVIDEAKYNEIKIHALEKCQELENLQKDNSMELN